MDARLYQQATYVNGMSYAFHSDLPMLRGYETPRTRVLDRIVLQVKVQGQSATQFVARQVVTSQSRRNGQTQRRGGNGRLQNSAVIQQPGLVMA
jgi:hypothetical protein